MERYTRFRDAATSVNPFYPTPSDFSYAYLPVQVTVLLIRLPLVLLFGALYFLILLPALSHSPATAAALALATRTLLFLAGLSCPPPKLAPLSTNVAGPAPAPSRRAPAGPTLAAPAVVLANSSSPLDPFVLLAAFPAPPVFAATFPDRPEVELLSAPAAAARALSAPRPAAPPTGSARLLTVPDALAACPGRPLVLFAEGTPTNGRGILPLSPAVAAAAVVGAGGRGSPVAAAPGLGPAATNVLLAHVRYAPAAVVTPVPGPRAAAAFAWALLTSLPFGLKAVVRVGVLVSGAGRGGEAAKASTAQARSVAALEQEQARNRSGRTVDVQKTVDTIGEELALLAGGNRVVRVKLGVKDKVEFLKVWGRSGR